MGVLDALYMIQQDQKTMTRTAMHARTLKHIMYLQVIEKSYTDNNKVENMTLIINIRFYFHISKVQKFDHSFYQILFNLLSYTGHSFISFNLLHHLFVLLIIMF